MNVLLLLLAAQAVDPLAPLEASATPKVKAERMVRRGEMVTLRIRQGAMTISTPARALSDAGAGERVRLVVTATRRTLDAVAEAPGVVTLSER